MYLFTDGPSHQSGIFGAVATRGFVGVTNVRPSIPFTNCQPVLERYLRFHDYASVGLGLLKHGKCAKM